jgi:hypothetical protein
MKTPKLKIRKIYLLTVIIVLVSTASFAQPKSENKTLWDKMYVGGNLGLQFGTITDIEVSPHVGYNINPWLSAGVGFTYEYYNRKAIYAYQQNIDTHIYGYNIFSRVAVIRDMGKTFGIGNGVSIIGQAEFEELSLEKKYFERIGTSDEGRFWLDSFLVGGGIKQAIGQRSSIYILIMWNLNETVNSPYSNPIFQIGFDF